MRCGKIMTNLAMRAENVKHGDRLFRMDLRPLIKPKSCLSIAYQLRIYPKVIFKWDFLVQFLIQNFHLHISCRDE